MPQFYLSHQLSIKTYIWALASNSNKAILGLLQRKHRHHGGEYTRENEKCRDPSIQANGARMCSLKWKGHTNSRSPMWVYEMRDILYAIYWGAIWKNVLHRVPHYSLGLNPHSFSFLCHPESALQSLLQGNNNKLSYQQLVVADTIHGVLRSKRAWKAFLPTSYKILNICCIWDPGSCNYNFWNLHTRVINIRTVACESYEIFKLFGRLKKNS